jgi:hypothetical protein
VIGREGYVKMGIESVKNEDSDLAILGKAAGSKVSLLAVVECSPRRCDVHA